MCTSDRLVSGIDIRACSSEGCETPSNEVILRSEESFVVICDCAGGSGSMTPVRGHMEYKQKCKVKCERSI